MRRAKNSNRYSCDNSGVRSRPSSLSDDAYVLGSDNEKLFYVRETSRQLGIFGDVKISFEINISRVLIMGFFLVTSKLHWVKCGMDTNLGFS